MTTFGREPYPSRTRTDKTQDIASVALVNVAEVVVSEALCTALYLGLSPGGKLPSTTLSRDLRMGSQEDLSLYKISRLNEPATAQKTFEPIGLDIQLDFGAAFQGLYALKRHDGYHLRYFIMGKLYD